MSTTPCWCGALGFTNVNQTIDYEKEALRQEIDDLKRKLAGHRSHMQRHFPKDHAPEACWEDIVARLREEKPAFNAWAKRFKESRRLPDGSYLLMSGWEYDAWIVWRAALGLTTEEPPAEFGTVD